MIYECDQCQAVLPPNEMRCPQCGETFDGPVPADAEVPAKGFTAKQATTSSTPKQLPKSVQGLESRQLIGLSGAVILFVGAFAPIISVPVAGSINYFQNGKGDGTIIIGLAIISAVLALIRRYIGLWLTGAASLGLLTFTYLNLQAHLSGAQESMGVELADNPFKGFGDIILQSIQIQWGWALLIIGALLLVGAAALKSEAGPSDDTPQRVNRTIPTMSAILLALLVGGSVICTRHEKTKMVNEAKAKVAQEAEAKRQQQNTEQQAEAIQQRASQAEDQAKQDALNQLTLGIWKWDSTEYSRALVGTIQNDSNRTIDFVSVNFNLLDKDGDKVGTAEDTIASLNPGETWKFRAGVFQDEAQRATLNGIKGRAEVSPMPPPSVTPDSPPPALPLSQLPANAWPVPKKIPTYTPGKSLDKILIGQLREALLATIGRKPDNSSQFKDGMSEDTWTTKYRDQSGMSDDNVSISVLFRQDKVVQAEISLSGEGPRMLSFNKLISQNKRLTKVCYGVTDLDDKGQPAGGYDQFYYDDVHQGIAYGAGPLQDDFILTTSPNSLVIHSPNVPVTLEVVNATVSIDTGREATAYRTQDEADKADKAQMP